MENLQTLNDINPWDSPVQPDCQFGTVGDPFTNIDELLYALEDLWDIDSNVYVRYEDGVFYIKSYTDWDTHEIILDGTPEFDEDSWLHRGANWTPIAYLDNLHELQLNSA